MSEVLSPLKKKGVNYKAEALSIIILRRALIIPEKRVMYVVSIVAYHYQDRCRPHKRRNWIFTHVGLSVHAHNIVQEVWSSRMAAFWHWRIDLLCCSFLTLVHVAQTARFGARLTHRLNRKFVRTDDTTQDSDETATAFENKALVCKSTNPTQENVARSL